MKKLLISSSKPYPLYLGEGVLGTAGELLLSLHRPCTAVIVSGPDVWPLYGETVETSLKRSGFRVLHFLHPGGESAKTLEVYGELLNYLCDRHVGRGDLLLALGGGVCGDLCGFAAATYLRGIAYIQLPTTLLAMVDSSVGGKTALNLTGGKNQAGAFYSPSAVFADTLTLSSLPYEQLLCGAGEVVKYAFALDKDLFSLLENGELPSSPDVILRCIHLKQKLVEQDEFDTGARRLLNFGHSFGHAIEYCSGYTLPHGIAVALGMVLISGACVRKGLLPEKDYERLLSLLRKLGLPVECGFDKKDILSAAASDKKRSGESITLILPRSVGHCEAAEVPLAGLGGYLD